MSPPEQRASVPPVALSSLDPTDRAVLERLDRELAPLAGQGAPGQPFQLDALREVVDALRTAGAGLAEGDPRREALQALRDEASLETLSKLATAFGRGRITQELHERAETAARAHRALLRQRFSGLGPA